MKELSDTLTKNELGELINISKNQPVPSGNLIDAESASSPYSSAYKLKQKGLILFYNDIDKYGWCLTNKGIEFLIYKTSNT